MKSVNVRELKNNPSNALRLAREDMVVVMNRDTPDAVLVHLDDETLLNMPGVRLALATALFRDGDLSLGQSGSLGAGRFDPALIASRHSRREGDCRGCHKR